MKYANMFFDGNRTGSVNLGDDMQLVAIDNIYRQMGIAASDVIRIPYSQLQSYDGDYVILPISFPLYGYNRNMYVTMFSPKIIPVFLGLSILSGTLSDEEVLYLKSFEPIGCRDYRSVLELRKNNIIAYVGGCMTALFPQRKNTNCNAVYLVDIPESYKKYIPEDILSRGIECSQIKINSVDAAAEAKAILDDYCRNAALVITTRLHCALPCLASGIPVVIMKERFSYRFTAIARYTHIYTRDEFADIDWNPEPISYEEDKQRILKAVKKRITDVYDKYSGIFDVSAFYEETMPTTDVYVEHFDNVVEYMDQYADANGANFKYAIWGITQKSELIYEYIMRKYPEARLVAVYDRNKRVKWHGIETVSSMEALSDMDTVVIVTAATANRYAVEYFEKIGKSNYHISDDGIKAVSKSGITAPD